MKNKLLSLCLLASCVFGDENPPHISMLTQYLNDVVYSTASTYAQQEKYNKNLTPSVVALGSDSYDVLDLSLPYIYNNKYGIALYLPFVNSHVSEEPSESGVGDTTVEISFDAGNFEDDMEFENNIFGLRYTFATGDEEKNLGMGHDSLALLWDSVYKLDSEWTFYGNLMWNFYFDDVRVNGIKYSMGSEDLLWIGVKHKCLLSQKVDTLVKLNWQGKYNNIPDQHYDMVDITLQFQSDTLVKNSALTAGVKLPVWDSKAVSNEFSFFIGMTFL